MTASGVGLDFDSLVEEWYRNDILRLLMRFGTAPFNINNEISDLELRPSEQHDPQYHLGLFPHGHRPAHLA